MRQYTLSEIDHMEGHTFEYFCAELLKANGYEKVEVTPGSGDQGIDVIARKDGIKYGIQCKCYSSDIGNKAVQEAYSGKEFYNCHIGAVLTNRSFTAAATELAKKNRILLWDRQKLVEMMKVADVLLSESDKAEYDHQRQIEQEELARERWETAQRFAEDLRQKQTKEAEEAAKKKAESESRIALEESRRDNIKKEINKISPLGGGTALGFLAIGITEIVLGDNIEGTLIARILGILAILLLIITVVLFFYSRSLTKEYERAERCVDELKREQKKN